MSLSKIQEYELLFPSGAIVDGVVDAEKYLTSHYRIAWFLKEPYSSEVDGFHMSTLYAQPDAYENFFKDTARTTWHPIIYCSYGILNGFLKWKEIPYIRHKPAMCEVVQRLAIINVNKMPSKTNTITLFKNLDEAYEKYQPLLEKQIDALEPQVNIFGNTFYLYKKDLRIGDEHLVSESCGEGCDVYEKDGKLYLDVYHPAQRRQLKEQYNDLIIKAVETWARKKRA